MAEQRQRTGLGDKMIDLREGQLDRRTFLVYELALPSPLGDISALQTHEELERIQRALASYPAPIAVKLVRQEQAGLIWRRVILVIDAADQEQRRVNEILAPRVAQAGAALRRLAALS